jgi:predicted glycosyltransferase
MIGYYVHHHGSGHQRRMQAIAHHLRTPMTVLSSAPRSVGYDGPWIELPADTADAPADVTAHGTSHWVPLHHTGLRNRMAAIARWVEHAAPTLFVVDVSCEVARFVRLMGVPVVVVAMRGERTDRAHRDAYDLAHALLAPWTAQFSEPDWPAQWLEKTWYVGAFSTVEKRERPIRTVPPGERHVALLWGSGGSEVEREQVEQARAATPDWRWHVLGIPGYEWHVDPWPLLCAADVIITHAGQNAIAEVAAARKPAVVLPQLRPHHEQEATARSLRRADLATVLTAWPDAGEWASILETSMWRDGARWAAWAPGDGALQAAAAIDQAAIDLRCIGG